MGRRNAIGLGCWILAGVVLSAASEIWDKPYNTWTDMELKQMLTGSPWAGKGGISRITQKGAEAGTVDDSAMVVWTSAKPMRQALVRQQITAGATVSAELEASIAEPLPAYTVSVKISDGPNSSSFARAAAVSQTETFLRREGKPPIAATQAEGRTLDKNGKPVEAPGPPRGGGAGAPRGAAPSNGPLLSVQGGGGGRGGGGGFGGGGGGQGGSSLLVFTFPKTDAITLADKEVEFVTKLCTPSFGGRGAPGAPGAQPGAPAAQPGGQGSSNCQFNVKKKFKPKDMQIKGELAL